MKKLITYPLIFMVIFCLKSFSQTPDKEIKPLSKGVYSTKGKKEFRKEKKEKKHVFKLWKRIFHKHNPTASVASVRSNPHFAKELKNERNSKQAISRREKKSLKKTEKNIQAKAVLRLRLRKRHPRGEK